MVVAGKDKKDLWRFCVTGFAVALVLLGGYFLFLKDRPAQKPRPGVVRPAVRPGVKPLPQKVMGRIAIVLDDWGYNRYHCKYLENFGVPVAPAILPNLEYSKDVLKCARACGQEPILHLPLEPYVNRNKYPPDYILTTSMSQKEVARLLDRILDEYAGIVGVNNHMGSKATEDKELMTTILKELKRRKLFFIDSVTSGRSVCPEVARDVGIPFAKRAVFLDNRNERGAIERAFAEGAKIARDTGFALIIGHDRELTLKIVTEQVRKLKAQGYLFLSLKDFIRAQGK